MSNYPHQPGSSQFEGGDAYEAYCDEQESRQMSKTVELNIPRTAAERLAAQEWKCAGCGKPSPNREKSCDCPTAVVTAGKATAWKRAPRSTEIVASCHALIGRLFETPDARLKPPDIDLIKTALTHLAEKYRD